MQTKFLKAVAVVLTFALLTACFPKNRKEVAPPIIFESTEIRNEAAVQPESEMEMEIETVEGTPAEKVEIYTEKAQEAQMKLQQLLESNLLEIPEGTSFIEKFIPTAFAEDSAITEEQIEELLTTIQIYTELATEAATESNDPEEIVELLEDVQEAQVETAEIIEEAIIEADEEAAEVLIEAAEEVTESMEEVEDAVVEVEMAVASGEEEMNIEIETDVENFIFDGSRKIKLREMMNPVIRAEKKVRRLKKAEEKVEEKLTAGEISEEEAAEILEKIENQLENNEEMRTLQAAFHEAKELGNEATIESAHEAIKEFNRSAVAEKAEKREAKILEKIEQLPEGEQADALEKHEERKEQQKVRRTEKNEFREKVGEIKAEMREARESGDEDAIEAVKETIKIHREEIRQKREVNILEKIEDLPEEKQTQALEKYEERKIQHEEITVRKQEALEEVKADRTMLREARELGDEEAIETAQETIKIHQEETREELQERREELEKTRTELQGARKDIRKKVPGVKVGCQEDAKDCPDGTIVGRVLPNCEFAPCPEEDEPVDDGIMDAHE